MSKNRLQAKFEAFWVDVIRSAHRALLNTADSRPFFVPIIGEENFAFLQQNEVQQGFVKATLADLTGEFDYGVKLNSTTPIDPGAEFAKVAQILTITRGLQNPIIDPVFAAKRLVTLGGEDEARWVVDKKAAVAMGQDPNQPGQPESGPAPSMDTMGPMANATGGPT